MVRGKPSCISDTLTIIKKAEKPVSIKQLESETGLQRSTIIIHLKILEESDQICKLEESSSERFQRHSQEGLHSYRGRKQFLYQSIEKCKVSENADKRK